jgi:hypothetical protein
VCGVGRGVLFSVACYYVKAGIPAVICYPLSFQYKLDVKPLI